MNSQPATINTKIGSFFYLFSTLFHLLQKLNVFFLLFLKGLDVALEVLGYRLSQFHFTPYIDSLHCQQ